MSERARLTPRRVEGLRSRAQVLAAIRDFFAAEDFLEIESPLRVPAPGLEVHLKAVPADGWYLITSPEFQMKRLLVGGLKRIFTVCRCFRGEEEGRHHKSEFSMLEWYRAGETLEKIIADTQGLVASVCERVAGRPVARVGGREIDVSAPWPRYTVAEAFEKWVGCGLRGDESAVELASKLRGVGVEIGAAIEWDDLFFCAFLSRIEPELAAMDRAVVVHDWPVPLAALARPKPSDPRVVERFEAYIGGVELCNAFGELTVPEVQRARFARDLAAKESRGYPLYPVDEKFLAALEEGMPPSAGIALGVDRLVMLAAGIDHIRDVSAFTRDEL